MIILKIHHFIPRDSPQVDYLLDAWEGDSACVDWLLLVHIHIIYITIGQSIAFVYGLSSIFTYLSTTCLSKYVTSGHIYIGCRPPYCVLYIYITYGLTFTVVSTVAICTVTHAGVIISGTAILTHSTAGWNKSIYTGIQGLWCHNEGALMHFKQCINYVNCNTHYRFAFLPWHSAPTWLSSPHNVLTFTVWPTEAICTVTHAGSII